MATLWSMCSRFRKALATAASKRPSGPTSRANRWALENTVAKWLRYQGSSAVPTGRSPSAMLPALGWYRPASSFISVDLPLPLPPTIKTVSPADSVSDTGPRRKPRSSPWPG
ncbi:hypothetical protein D3C72_1750990 [compost metagenome]